jgi:hypothetical protein
MAKKLTKLETSRRLGVSTRAINRYVGRGRLKVDYRKNNNGSWEAVYDEGEVAALRESFGQPPTQPAFKPVKPRKEKPPANRVPGPLELRTESQSLAVVELSAALVELARAATVTRTTVALERKLTLDIAGCVELSGLSEEFLLDAIERGGLKAAQRGAGWNVKNRDLRRFVRKL